VKQSLAKFDGIATGRCKNDRDGLGGFLSKRSEVRSIRYQDCDLPAYQGAATLPTSGRGYEVLRLGRMEPS
jgi:hypothetical protein